MYVWNLWVFRHEIVVNHRLPFLTSEILALSPPVPLALHNYTTFANVLAFPLIPLLGVVKTFNLLVIGSGVMTGYAMYFYARMRTGDAAAAWIGGLLFGFSPFMSARAAEHFSLTLAAPLPIFGWLMFRIYSQPTVRLACAAGATVAWAFLCDAYYAVYCLMMAGFMACYSMFSVETRPTTVRRMWPRSLVDLAIVCLAGLIVGMLLRGGGQVDVFGIRVSFTRLYTPVLVLTLHDRHPRLDDGPAAHRGRCRCCRTPDGGRGARRLCGDPLARAVGDRVDLRAAPVDQPADVVAEQRAGRRSAGVLRAQSAPSAVRIAVLRMVGVASRAASTRTSPRCRGWRSSPSWRRRSGPGSGRSRAGSSSRACSRGSRSGRSSSSRSS